MPPSVGGILNPLYPWYSYCPLSSEQGFIPEIQGFGASIVGFTLPELPAPVGGGLIPGGPGLKGGGPP
ncbi:hypothetical protein FGO68_gene1558 [Halteria grandinella]|uniref:Uncharacterized protein n=1 Tax=Halteria grandinella TaxID=5974 RepID=A0A8J8P432_HALGN|nr:hypothetical protein FGO68_gene1558 [Halteria grandinella]